MINEFINSDLYDRLTLLGILTPTDFFLELSNLINRGFASQQPVLVAALNLKLIKNDSLDNSKLVVHKLAEMLKIYFFKKELIGYNDTTDEFTLAMKIEQPDVLKYIENNMHIITDSTNAYLPSDCQFQLLITYTIKIPDATTFADTLISDSKKSYLQLFS